MSFQSPEWITKGAAVSIAVVCPLISFIFIAYVAKRILRQSAGTGKQVEIAQAIMDGSYAYMWRQYKVITFFVIAVAIVLAAIMKTPIDPTQGHHGGTTNEPYWVLVIHFLAGAALSSLSGVVGMNIAIRSNVRTTEACKGSGGLNRGLRVAFDSGTVMGLSVVSFVVFGQAVLFWIFEDQLALSGFGFGASLVALFSRVGGGIFTKAADVGSDLVGKVEAGIPEDDPRNPGVIADNVGDNVGDVAGLGADLFESYVGATVAAVPLGFKAYQNAGVALPFWISGAGILASIIGTFAVKTKEGASQGELLAALRKGVIVSAVLITIFALPVCHILFAPAHDVAWRLFFCNLTGLISGIMVGFVTEYTTSHEYSPTIGIAEASATGAATVLIQGLGVGMISTLGPGVILAVAALICSFIEGSYGVSIAAIGMLSTLGFTLATDAYGPVADNAGGIAEMAQLPPEVREKTDALDALGNTTAATGKGFAIGSALLITLALISAFVQETSDPNGDPIMLDVNDPLTLSGALIGSLLPFLFAALTMFAVGRSAQSIIREVRHQFKTIPGLLEGAPGVKPDYRRCVDLCTKAALQEMVLPALISVVAPVGFGYTFGSKFLGGVLVGTILSGFFLGTTMANAGGAWDNAKKYTEAGGLGPGKGKGSAAHHAVVVGDTVGDPFKDTSGPALNILSKLMSHLSLIISGSLAYEYENWLQGLVVWIVVAIFGVGYYCYQKHYTVPEKPLSLESEVALTTGTENHKSLSLNDDTVRLRKI